MTENILIGGERGKQWKSPEQMNKEKIPPVLSDGELAGIWETGENIDPFEDFARVAQAQRDADAAYYEPLIGEKAGEMLLWLEEHRHQDLAQGYHRFLATPTEYEDFKIKFLGEFISLIQQAKEEVAREIFEEIEKELVVWEDLSVKTQHQAAIAKTNWWQSLKDRRR